MGSDRHARLTGIFQRALELPVGERRRFVVAECGDDHELRDRLVRMLEADAEPSGFIEPPSPTASRDAESLAGTVIGSYRLVERLGSGGMGDVYLAERDGADFEKRVAVKVMKRGLDTDELLRRFLVERRALGALEHPGIAALIDGGSLPDGRPYFVMEFVAGKPIDAFCDARGLSLHERLELFLKVCDAVRHAHAHLVVHCDLKPANILVTADGRPKLLDFGIAKLLEADAPAITAVASARPLTIEYASPEQLRGEPPGTAADVYSLGVLLYELLVGRRPFSGATRSEIERAVQDVEPTRPSVAALSTRSDDRSRQPTAIAAARGLRPAALSRALAGDLDNIVSTALAKEPARRYRSVEQLAEDVSRHLSGLPVSSRAPTWGYRASKFLRRNRLPVASVASILLVLTIGLVGVSWQAREADDARERAELALSSAEKASAAERAALEEQRIALLEAEAARKEAQSVIEFLEEVLGSANPVERGRDVTVVEVIDTATKTVQQRFGSEPLVEASVRAALGRTLLALGRLSESREQLEAALALRRANLDSGHPQIAVSLGDLGSVLYALDDARGALTRFEEALRTIRAGGARDEYGHDVALGNVAAALNRLGEYGRARELYEEILARRRELHGETHPAVAEALNNLSSSLRGLGDVEGAIDRIERAIAIRRACFGDRHTLVAQSLSNLAVLRLGRGESELAEPLLREAIAIHREALGGNHPDLATDLSNLGSVLCELRRYAEAERAYTECLEIRKSTLREDSFVLAGTEVRLALALFGLGRFAEAEPLFARNRERFESEMGVRDATTRTIVAALARCNRELGRLAEAEKWELWLRENGGG